MSRWALSEPDPHAGEVDPQIEAERIRLEQWEIFVQSLRDYAARDGCGWGWVLDRVRMAYVGNVSVRFCSPITQAFLRDTKEFADLYGWPDTLRAVAQAIQADETLKREAMDRR